MSIAIPLWIQCQNLVKEYTCFKNAFNLSCIDLFVTNSPLSFQHTKAVSDGLPDFQKMVITVIKMSFKRAAKLSLKIMLSSSCKNLFLQCVCYWYSLFRWMILFPCDNWKTLLFIKVYSYSEGHVIAFFETSVWKKFTLAVLIPNF